MRTAKALAVVVGGTLMAGPAVLAAESGHRPNADLGISLRAVETFPTITKSEVAAVAKDPGIVQPITDPWIAKDQGMSYRANSRAK